MAAQKRKHSEVAGYESMHSSRQANLGVAPKPKKKHRKQELIVSNPTSINPLKKKVRDVARLLAHSEDLSADVRLENERALAAYKQDLADAEFEKRRQKMIKKYHMVRFFERQKATRILKKLNKRLESVTAEDGKQKLEADIHQAEVDLNYALYCPLAEKYTSLYPPNKDSIEHEKPPLWKDVEKHMSKGTLQALRDRKDPNLTPEQAYVPLPKRPREKRAKNKNTPKATPDKAQQDLSVGRDEDDESDGGFFEE